jgi:hypothetical protein
VKGITDLREPDTRFLVPTTAIISALVQRHRLPGTLLHEAAHAIAHVRGAKDTSRQGRRHNARFKTLAEELGITVTKDPRTGWSPTTLPEATRSQYATTIAALGHPPTAHACSATSPRSPPSPAGWPTKTSARPSPAAPTTPLAIDTAGEADDHEAAAQALGHHAELTRTQGHLTAAPPRRRSHPPRSRPAPRRTCPDLHPWLAALEATTHADRGDYTAACDALHAGGSP